MNDKTEKLKLALAEAKATMKSLKDDIRTLKADNKEALKTVKGGAMAKETKNVNIQNDSFPWHKKQGGAKTNIKEIIAEYDELKKEKGGVTTMKKTKTATHKAQKKSTIKKEPRAKAKAAVTSKTEA